MESSLPSLKDDGESVFLAEPLLVSQSGPNWGQLERLAQRIFAKSDILNERARELHCDDLDYIRRRALRCEMVSSFEIEGEVAPSAFEDTFTSIISDLAAAPTLDTISLHRSHGLLMQLDCSEWGYRKHFVQVGRHVAPSPGSISRIITHMAKGYSHAGRTSRLIGAACCHHRLSWVHAYHDGNGRVGRAVLLAMLRSQLPSAGLWSLSDRLLLSRDEYLSVMAGADEVRRGDRDGRGHLSEMRLTALAMFILRHIEGAIDGATLDLRS